MKEVFLRGPGPPRPSRTARCTAPRWRARALGSQEPRTGPLTPPAPAPGDFTVSQREQLRVKLPDVLQVVEGLPLVALHLSLLLRVAGDLTLRLDLRRRGGMLNALAIVLFLLLTLASALQAHWQPEHREAPVETLNPSGAPAGIGPITARSPDDGRKLNKEVQDGTA